jgi:hypothetical protein
MFAITLAIVASVHFATALSTYYNYARNGILPYNIIDGGISNEGQEPRIVYDNGTVTGRFADYTNQLHPYNYSAIASQELLDWVKEDEVDDHGNIVKPSMKSMAEGKMASEMAAIRLCILVCGRPYLIASLLALSPHSPHSPHSPSASGYSHHYFRKNCDSYQVGFMSNDPIDEVLEDISTGGHGCVALSIGGIVYVTFHITPFADKDDAKHAYSRRRS